MKSEFSNKFEELIREWDFEDAWRKAGAVKMTVSPPTHNSFLNNISSKIV
jgi:ribosome-associated toxin RatA of RatAB toxin-antitoxin module